MLVVVYAADLVFFTVKSNILYHEHASVLDESVA